MLRRPLIAFLTALSLAFSGAALVSGSPAAGATRTGMATETQQFTGYGSSGFGFALDYARADARRQANAAGFYDCTEILVWDPSPYTAMVVWECTR